MISEEDYAQDPALTESPFCKTLGSTPLRVTCYGSSSAKTPTKFKKEAFNLGYILAKRGHTCVNGAGSFGCMAAMNDGAEAGNGHIVGVIHEMFVVDGSDWCARDGGAHRIFSDANGKSSSSDSGPIRDILVAGGDDLQERKRLLVDGADALVVLPGGPGTWDELWEMACARNLGLTNLPIVCVSVGNFYQSFGEMLQRAYEEGLVKNRPEDVVHFVPTAEQAVRWIEAQKEKGKSGKIPSVKKRSSVLKGTQSFISPPVVSNSKSFSRSSSNNSEGSSSWRDGRLVEEQSWRRYLAWSSLPFLAGLAVGLLSTSHFQARR